MSRAYIRTVMLFALLLCAEGAFAQARTGTVAGRLTTARGNPAMGVRVAALSAAEPAAQNNNRSIASLTQTDSDGRYILEGIPPGVYTITAGPFDDATSFPNAVRITAGSAVADVNFVFTGAVNVKVSGRVVPTPEARNFSNQVLLSGNGRDLTTRAGADGKFEFPSVPTGTYNLFAFLDEMQKRLTLTVFDTNVQGIELRPSRMLELKGAIETAGGGLRPRVRIAFTGVPAPVDGGTLTPSSLAVLSGRGEFKSGIQEGEYRVTVEDVPKGFTVRALTAGAVDLRTAPLIVNGAAPPPITVKLEASNPPPWSPVGGRIENIPRAPANSKVILWGVLPNLEILETPVRPDGSFEFPMVLPGEYQAYLAPVPDVAKDRPRVVTIPRGGLTDLRISPPITMAVPGQIIVEGGGPPPRLAFILNSSSSGASSIKILPGPDGRFVLNLPEDTYRAAWEAPASSGLAFPAGYSVRSFTYAGKNVFTDSFNIDRTNSAEFVVTIAATPTAWTNVSGTVRGLGTTNARIAITGSPVFTLPDVPVAADGSFKLLKVPQGSYMLRLFTASNSTPVTTLAITVGTEEITGLEIIVGR